MEPKSIPRQVITVVKSVFTLPPPGSPDRLFRAAIISFLGGAVGAGIVLRSWLDFFALAVLILGLDQLGVPSLVAWCLCGFWAIVRVMWRDRATKRLTSEVAKAQPAPSAASDHPNL